MLHPSHNKILSALSFFPNTNGVGWSFFTQDAVFHKASMMRSRKRNISEYVARMRKLINEYMPDTIVFPERTKKRGKRVNEIIDMVSVYAQSRGIEVKEYTADQKKFILNEVGGVYYDHDIAQALVQGIPDLEEFSYEKRDGGHEPYYSAVLKSVIYAYTHFYLNE